MLFSEREKESTMMKLLNIRLSAVVSKRTLIFGGALLLAVMVCHTTFSYERYNGGDDPPGCAECHGSFTDGTSTKDSVFPGDDKHRMHRSGSYMNTDCDLCHSDGDNDDPFIGSSNGTSNNEGLGCNGCHNAFGLRAHHAVNGVEDNNGFTCADCHPGDGTPPGEDEVPPYYGTADTDADNPTNDVLAANVNENWTEGDFLGLDNDGDNLYDLADFDCGPLYKLVDIETVGSDIRITWETVGGRTDMLQATSNLTNTFTDVGSSLTIPGVGVVTTNVVETGGALSAKRFYRIRYAP